MSELSEGILLDSRFSLQRRLGRGGAGEVWLADDRELSRQIALKVLRPELANNEAYRSSLIAEFNSVKVLTHPGIVQVFDLHELSERVYFSMQYLPGGALTALRGAPWPQVVQALLPVAEALEYSHRAGVIHRDIKSSNIIYSVNALPVLTDFGLALPPDALADSGAALSLPAVSPQQLAGAPAAVGDDVYGFGALLYELIAGQPLFYPDVSQQKVLNETPARLDTLNLSVQPPPELVGLVATMLQKQTLRRPQSMAAVRSALENLTRNVAADEVADSTQSIQPRRRPVAPEPEGVARAARTQAAAPSGGVSRKAVTAIVVLVAVLLFVVLWLPEQVARENSGEHSRDDYKNDYKDDISEVPQTVDTGTDAEPGNVLSTADPMARQKAEAVLGELLPLVDDLREQAVERWGGNDWFELERLSAAADELLKDRDYSLAATTYSDALTLARALQARVPLTLQQALDDGLQALNEAQQAAAVEAFELALAIDSENTQAQQGLARAQVLDQVLSLMNEGAQAEAAGDWDTAASQYENVLQLDSLWEPASEALQRVRTSASGERFGRYMSDGFAAMSAKQYAQARTAFRAALGERPGNQEAAAALVELAAAEKTAGIRQAMAQAKIAVATENWQAAVTAYDTALSLDSKLSAAIDGRKIAADRLDLQQQLINEIARAETFNDQRAWDRANGVLLRAQSVGQPGPVLSGQIAELSKILTVATIPLAVSFRSDGVTSVVIYKVGKLGQFENRVVELRPGRYTVVGNRPGYRDVRKTLLIEPETPVDPVVIECKEPI